MSGARQQDGRGKPGRGELAELSATLQGLQTIGKRTPVELQQVRTDELLKLRVLALGCDGPKQDGASLAHAHARCIGQARRLPEDHHTRERGHGHVELVPSNDQLCKPEQKRPGAEEDAILVHHALCVPSARHRTAGNQPTAQGLPRPGPDSQGPGAEITLLAACAKLSGVRRKWRGGQACMHACKKHACMQRGCAHGHPRAQSS